MGKLANSKGKLDSELVKTGLVRKNKKAEVRVAGDFMKIRKANEYNKN